MWTGKVNKRNGSSAERLLDDLGLGAAPPVSKVEMIDDLHRRCCLPTSVPRECIPSLISYLVGLKLGLRH